MEPVAHRLFAHPQQVRHLAHRFCVRQSQQRVNPPNQAGRVSRVSTLQTLAQDLARRAGQCDSYHDGILSRSQWVRYNHIEPQDAVKRQPTEPLGNRHEELSEGL